HRHSRALRRYRYWKLIHRHKGLNLTVFTKIRILRIRNNADNLIGAPWITWLRTHADLNPQRARRVDILPDESLVDDDHQRGIVGVAIGEVTPLDQRNAKGREKAWADISEPAWPIDGSYLYFVPPGGTAERNVGACRSVVDARNGAHLLD